MTIYSLVIDTYTFFTQAALPMIAFSAVGWILFALSFGIYRNRYCHIMLVYNLFHCVFQVYVRRYNH